MSKAKEGEVRHSTTALQSANFRRTLGTFATGVTVVATRSKDDEVRAFTANSFTSVSLDPPLVLACLARRSASVGAFANVDGYSISVLEASQLPLSDAFASRNPETKLAATTHLCGDTVPYVPDSLATFLCTPEQVVDAGDHLILIGKVERFVVNKSRPLACLRGAYVGVEAAPLEKAPVRASVTVGGVLGQNGRVLLVRSPGSSMWSTPTVALHSGIRFEHALQQRFSGIGV
ncbi:flavin reductase family protein [Caballeronia sp. GAWG2-1]|uniref:flavin reductase family protein n=1 Tax=Caballeronia sp. GAWG2-1 TaxID=2921744 RepID=UPI0020279B33|nr:flavin reductase family protein [Caballeronia sp. GAWG2-1]